MFCNVQETEVYSEPNETYEIEHFAKIINE